MADPGELTPFQMKMAEESARKATQAISESGQLKAEVALRLQHRAERLQIKRDMERERKQLAADKRRAKFAAKKAKLVIHRVFAKKPGPKKKGVKAGPAAIITHEDGSKTLNVLDYRHEGMIDDLIENPKLSNRDLGDKYGVSPSYIQICKTSDKFTERLKERRAEVVNPLLTATVEHRLRAITHSASERVLENLENDPTPDFALKTWVEALRFNGYGQKASVNINAGQGSLVTILSGLPSAGEIYDVSPEPGPVQGS